MFPASILEYLGRKIKFGNSTISLAIKRRILWGSRSASIICLVPRSAHDTLNMGTRLCDMDQEILHEGKSAAENDFIVLEGPQRSYLPVDMLWKHRVGTVTRWDVILALAISCGYAVFRLTGFANDYTLDLQEDELELYEAVEYYRQGRFYLSPLGALGVQIYSLVPLCKTFMRKVSLGFASATLGTFYLGAKRAGVSRIFALASVLGIGYLPLFQLQSSLVCPGTLQSFLLSVVFYSWQSFTYFPPLGISWISHLLLLAVSLGLSLSTKYLGFATWAWVCGLVLFQFWNTIGDVRLTSCFVAKYALLQILILTLIPSTIFVTSNALQLSHWTEDSPEFSKYMSSNFKSYLRGPIEHPVGLTYGSIVTLRHLESLGGYLHSHNYMYETGSFGQQITVTQEEGDPENEWIVEGRFPDKDKLMINKKIHDVDQIRLRHRSTGKLLRASTSKPPISQEEYDLEVSGTGDFDYEGDSDELWNIRLVNGPRRSIIRPLESIVKLSNEGHSCSLISHDIRLPESGFYQQEVLCVEEAMEPRSYFQFETAKPATEGEEYDSYYCKKCRYRCAAELLIEFWQRQIEYVSYENNHKKAGSYDPESWPFIVVGKKLADNIWISGSLIPIIFAVYKAVQLLKWNPYAKSQETTLNSALFDKVGFECSLGWVFHFYPFFKNPHQNLDITLYLPALLLGHMLSTQVINSLYNWKHWSLACVVVYLAMIVYY